MNLLQLFYSKPTALSKFTCGRKSPEGYPCSSHPSEAMNLVTDDESLKIAVKAWFEGQNRKFYFQGINS